MLVFSFMYSELSNVLHEPDPPSSLRPRLHQTRFSANSASFLVHCMLNPAPSRRCQEQLQIGRERVVAIDDFVLIPNADLP